MNDLMNAAFVVFAITIGYFILFQLPSIIYPYVIKLSAKIYVYCQVKKNRNILIVWGSITLILLFLFPMFNSPNSTQNRDTIENKTPKSTQNRDTIENKTSDPFSSYFNNDK